MSERYGSWGKILRVDLTKGTTSVEEMDEATFRRHPGGRALIAHYLLTELPKDAEPLGPENILVFAMGVLTGTPLSGASRHAVGAKSPLTGGFGEAEVGGEDRESTRLNCSRVENSYAEICLKKKNNTKTTERNIRR